MLASYCLTGPDSGKIKWTFRQREYGENISFFDTW